MPTDKKPKVLITYIEAGLGHIISAKAISDALHNEYGDKLEIVDDYMCRDSADPVMRKFEKIMVKNVKGYSTGRLNSSFHLGLLRFFGDRIAKWGMYHLVFRKYRNAVLRYFREQSPDIIVSTHFFISAWAVTYRKKYAPNVKVITYNPDYNTEGVWGSGEDLFIVNNPLAVKDCLKRKIPLSTIKEATFITRDDIKNFNLTKSEARAKHNIPENKFTVLLVNGAYGGGNLQCFTDELLRTDKEITVLVCAGKNEKLFEEYETRIASMPPNITLIPIGFRMDIYELYRAADIVITKSGANTVLECVYMNTPIIINYCAQMLENFTRDLFVGVYGVGEFISDPVKCRMRIEECIQTPDLLITYRENTYKIDKNNDGGKQIADWIFNAAY